MDIFIGRGRSSFEGGALLSGSFSVSGLFSVGALLCRSSSVSELFWFGAFLCQSSSGSELFCVRVLLYCGALLRAELF